MPVSLLNCGMPKVAVTERSAALARDSRPMPEVNRRRRTRPIAAGRKVS
jgi:hypothetical protein